MLQTNGATLVPVSQNERMKGRWINDGNENNTYTQCKTTDYFHCIHKRTIYILYTFSKKEQEKKRKARHLFFFYNFPFCFSLVLHVASLLDDLFPSYVFFFLFIHNEVCIQSSRQPIFKLKLITAQYRFSTSFTVSCSFLLLKTCCYTFNQINERGKKKY